MQNAAHAPERGAAALCDVVEVAQDRRDALAAIRAERASRVSVRVDAIVVLDVSLAVRVARNLRQLHVAKRLVGERLDLLQKARRRGQQATSPTHTT